jgi:hypothetical protein
MDMFAINSLVVYPKCRYYPQRGRIEDEEILSCYEKRKKRIKITD